MMMIIPKTVHFAIFSLSKWIRAHVRAIIEVWGYLDTLASQLIDLISMRAIHCIILLLSVAFGSTLCQEHPLRDYASGVKEVSTDRVIQRSFWRAHRINEKGDVDHSLITTDIQE